MPQMDTTARQVCLNAGGDAFTQEEDVGAILEIPRDYFQPDAVDRVYQQVTKFLQSQRSHQTMER